MARTRSEHPIVILREPVLSLTKEGMLPTRLEHPIVILSGSKERDWGLALGAQL
ncbi:MAG: hypothetical protein IH944_12125 [Armatimonadetes bacterium]|nr:hypothetical protein [Armatimonadota bacterium]